MIPNNISKRDVLKAIEKVRSDGVPKRRNSRKYLLIYQDKSYPPKYIVGLANWFANGVELDPEDYSGGLETNRFLTELGFEIVERTRAL